MPHRSRPDDRPPRRLELAHRRGVERMDRRTDAAVQGGIKLAPFAARHHRPGRQPHRRQHRPDHHRVRREHLAQQRHGRPVRPSPLRRLHRPRLDLGPGVFQHRTGQHILGLGMGRDAEPRHVDPHDPHAVDFRRQQLQRHAGRCRHAKVRHHHRVIAVGIGQFMHRITNVFEELARDQCFGVEGHIAHTPPRAVEVAHEGQPVDTAGRTGQHRRHPPHPQADAQRAEGRAHRLRLVMRSLRIVRRILVEDLRLSRGPRCPLHLARTAHGSPSRPHPQARHHRHAAARPRHRSGARYRWRRSGLPRSFASRAGGKAGKLAVQPRKRLEVKHCHTPLPAISSEPRPCRACRHRSRG